MEGMRPEGCEGPTANGWTVFDVVTGKGSRRDRRAADVRSTTVAVAAHVGLIAALLLLGRAGTEAFQKVGMGPGVVLANGGGGGGGGGGAEAVTYVNLPPAPPPAPQPTKPEEVPVPTPVPPPPPPVVTPPANTPPAPPAASTPAPQTTIGAGAGQGTGTGPGEGPGQGPGSGGGSGGGTGGGVGTGTGTGTGPGTGGGGIRPPSPRFMLLAPMRPRGVAPRDVVLRLFVDDRGKVQKAELVSGTGNRGYDGDLLRRAKEYEFEPARDPSGRPVAAQFEVTLSI
ncbi:MAG: TonB protein C-terminal [Gemmatimonadetes bacterium]|nr:TonB protein C-terminal [Gemmatimonadota bacterium]